MINFKYFMTLTLPALAIMCSLTSCNNDSEQLVNQSETSLMNVSTSIGVSTKAMVSGISLPSGSKIGITLTNPDGSDYNGKTTGYKNILYSAAGEKTSQSWSSKSPISLSATTGQAVAYYPYAETTDAKAITINSSSQTDYMYSGVITGLSSKSNKASFTMKHAMTLVRINVIKGTYNNTGAVSQLGFSSPAVGTGAVLNAENGSLSTVTGGNTSITPNGFKAFTIGTGTQYDTMLIPTGTKGDIIVKMTVDGASYTKTVGMSEALAAGNIYAVNLTLNNKSLDVTKVTVTDWVSKAPVSGEFEQD